MNNPMSVAIRSFFNQDSQGSPILLLFGQAMAHVSIFYVIFNFSLYGLSLSFLSYFLMTCLGVSITVHRGLTHKSIKFPRFMEFLGSLFFSLSLQGSTVAWVAMHREHHKKSDHLGDPHAPQVNPLRVHFFSMLYQPKLKLALDLLRDPLHYRLHRYYWVVQLITCGLLYFFYLDFFGVVYCYLFPAFLCWHGIGIAKTLCHLFGYRNFETNDNSFNLNFLSLLNFGEALHNNHHARPNRYSFSYRWYEIDISAIVIRIFSFIFKNFEIKGKKI